MKPTYIKPLWLSALCMGAVLGACSNDAEQAPSFGTTDEAPGRIEFTISLPGGSGVLYPTRMIQSDLECKITRLDVLEFRDKLDGDGNPVMWTLDDGSQVPAKEFVKYHSDDEINLSAAATPNQYTFSINKDTGDTAKHYFYFIANHDQDGVNEATGFKTLDRLAADFSDENEGETTTKDFFCNTNDAEYWMTSPYPIEESFSSDDFYSNFKKDNKEYGMRMSGVATSSRHGEIGGDNDTSGITIPENGSVQCFVDMTRVAARIDLYSYASNLVITDATLHNMYGLSFPFLFAKPEIDWSNDFSKLMDWNDYAQLQFDVTLNSEARGRLFLNAYDPADADNVENFKGEQEAQQWKEVYDVDHGIQKAFYCYETPNALALENGGKNAVSYVEVKFLLLDGTTGHVNVPFIRYDENGEPVEGIDIVRNNLYRVVIGDGEPVSPGADIKVRIEDVPWTVVDLPAIVD